MKKIILITIIFLLVLNLFAEEIQEPKERIDPNVFSIMPWNIGIGEGNKSKDNYFKELYDCGFNITGFLSPNLAKGAEKYNLKSCVEANYLIDNNIKDDKAKYEDWAKKLKEALGEENLNNVYQIYVKDEPWVKDISWVKTESQIVKNILKARPYVNLNPNYASNNIIGDNYVDYCDKIIQGCGLDYVSYDNYSFFVGYGLDEDRFYSNIEGIRESALNNKVIFVNIILSTAHFNYAVPNEYSINVQGWSTLAYGGRGLSYFSFLRTHHGNYGYCAYYKSGSRTPLWYAIRDMNFSIHNIMPYYKDLESVNVFHVGNVPKGCKGIESAKNIKKMNLYYGGIPAPHNNKAIAKTPNYLVGEFKSKKDGKDYVIIVNKDPEYSLFVDTLEFNKGSKITRIKDTPIDNQEYSFTGEDRWIYPGRGILLRCDD